MTKKRPSFHPSARRAMAGLWALVACGIVQTPLAACEPSINMIAVHRIDVPFAGEHPGYDAPNPADDEVRAEHAYISSGLADAFGLGFGPIDPDWAAPNPQIRVQIYKPITISNFEVREDGVNLYRDRVSGAIFTVVGVIDDPVLRLYVYSQESSTDTHSGEYKLFAADTALANGTRVEDAMNTWVNPGSDARLYNVKARAARVAPSSSSFTPVGEDAEVSQHFCEADPDGELTETAIQVATDDLLIMAPHAGGIETGVSDQMDLLEDELEGVANFWRAEGYWGDRQTSRRWHITSASISEESFPALNALSGAASFQPSHPFHYALAIHGFSSDLDETSCNGGADTDFYQLVVGGSATLDAKCLVADRIVDELGLGTVAISIRYEDDGDEASIDIEDGCGRTVEEEGKSGLSSDNVVNRMAFAGGIQVEQSDSLRDDDGLLLGVAQGLAQAMTDLLDGLAPGSCATLP